MRHDETIGRTSSRMRRDDEGAIPDGKQTQGGTRRENKAKETKAITHGQASTGRPARLIAKTGREAIRNPYENTGDKNGRKRQGRGDDNGARTRQREQDDEASKERRG